MHPSVRQSRRASQRYETIKKSTPGLRKPAGWGKEKLLTSPFNQKQAIEQQSDNIAATQIVFVLRYLID